MEFENAEQLKGYLSERFGITMPNEIRMKQTKSHGIRLYSPSVSTKHVFGLEGFMAYSKNTGLSPYFLQLIGHLAKKSIIALNKRDAIDYASGKPLKKKLSAQQEQGLVVLSYKNHILGYGILEGKGTIKFPMKEKIKRNLVNDVATYPGRNL